MAFLYAIGELSKIRTLNIRHMYGIKRKGREQSAKVHGAIKNSLKPFFEMLSAKTRYPARKVIINRWGRHHPKRVVCLYGMFAVIILSFNIMGHFLHDSSNTTTNSDVLNIARKSSVNPVQGMSQININRKVIGSTMQDYADVNISLAHRLDSLVRLDGKSRQDSIEILNIYKKLIKTRNNNEP